MKRVKLPESLLKSAKSLTLYVRRNYIRRWLSPKKVILKRRLTQKKVKFIEGNNKSKFIWKIVILAVCDVRRRLLKKDVILEVSYLKRLLF